MVNLRNVKFGSSESNAYICSMEKSAILLGDGYGEDIGVINTTGLSLGKTLEIASMAIAKAFGKEVAMISAKNWRELVNGGSFFEVRLKGEEMDIHMPVTITKMLN